MRLPEGLANGTSRRVFFFSVVLLTIEFLDELVFGAREAAWPLIRTDLGLSYAQVGLLLGVPGVIGNLIELPLGVLGDVWNRRRLIVGGGVVFGLGLLFIALAPSFWVLLLALILFYPASGAFVSLSEATLMDLSPQRHEQAMARWTLAGSLGVVGGPFVLGAAVWVGWGWRGLFVALAISSLVLAFITWGRPFLQQDSPLESVEGGLRAGFMGALQAIRCREVLHWSTLLLFSDFMLDVLLGFLALYFVDVVGVTPALAGSAIAVWSVVGLLGDALLVPLLEKVRGLVYLRYSAALILILFPAFLLTPTYSIKIVLLGVMGFANAGWYAILKAQLYTTLPKKSGTVMTINTFFSILAGFVPALLGFIAEQVGLAWMMWLLILGPVALLVGIRPAYANE